ncbi:MAG: hypothetical protein ACNA7T_12435 [Haliea sp.]|jgi:hypothetical protein
MTHFMVLAAMTLMTGMVSASDNLDGIPPMPQWQTDALHCDWAWQESGGIGFWAESCQLPSGLWKIQWDSSRSAFIQTVDEKDLGVVVQPWQVPPGLGIDALRDALVAHALLDPSAACDWKAIPLRGAPRTMSFYTLASISEQAQAMTEQGEVPEPVCGAYGHSTHGVRYFITDLRWPELVIFVDEGQERPLFEPRSISFRP